LIAHASHFPAQCLTDYHQAVHSTGPIEAAEVRRGLPIMVDASRPEASTSPPRYCPRCRAAGRPEERLCVECGETLRPQAYCAICEGFWKLDPGTDCPKHDVELLEDAPRCEVFLGPGDRASLVTVATFSHPNEANAPRIRLEAEGIPTFLDGERIAGSTLYQVATGGVRLQVPSSLASAARILISQTWSPPIEADEDLDDAWEDLAPEPGKRRREVMKLAILFFLFGPILLTLLSMLSQILSRG
jgi:hypothetical protein